VSELASLSTAIPSLLSDYEPADASSPLNVLHIALNAPIGTGAGAEEALIATAQAAIESSAGVLKAKGVRLVSLMVPNPPKWPRLFSFTAANGFAEDPNRRNMYPTFYNALELDRLQNWNPVRLPAISHNSVVLLGSQGAGRGVQQRVFARGVTHSDAMDTPEAAEGALLKAFNELWCAVHGFPPLRYAGSLL